MASTAAFGDSYDDMSFTPPHLATIQARTLIVQGDRDFLYPVELSVEMAKAIPIEPLDVPSAGPVRCWENDGLSFSRRLTPF